MVFFDIINYAALVDKLLLFLINAVGLELVLWAYIANRYTRPSRLFLAGVFYVLAWIDLVAIATLAGAGTPEMALWLVRCLYALLAVFFAGKLREKI